MWRGRLRGIALAGAIASCTFDSSGVGSGGSATLGDDSTTTDASTTTTPTAGDVTSADTTVSTTEMPSTDDTAPECEPGTIGCPCRDVDGDACDGDLVCDDGTCSSSTCGDGIVQRGEECEPDVGGGAAAGCADDCQFLRGARSVALGHEHTCAVKHDGTLRCWGDGDRGKLGLGSEDDIGREPGEPASAPNVDAGAAVLRVELGSGFSCALRVRGDVVCWGYRDNGRLGDGQSMMTQDIGDEAGETAGMLGPIDIPGVVTDLAVGGSHACALRSTGEVHCWGVGTGGRLGYANQMDVGTMNTPAFVGPVMLPDAFTVRQLAAGAGHTCALSSEGDVLCWGDGAAGILGAGNTTSIGDDEPVASGTRIQLGGEAMSIAAGSQHTCALMSDDTLRCWGVGDHGRLGYGNTDDIGDNELPDAAVPLPGLVQSVSAGRAHTCAVLEGGTALCWGEGAQGKLGRGNTDALGDVATLENETPIQIDDDPNAVVLAIEAGGDHTCAVLDQGRVRCWGLASAGQLGYGNADKIGDDEVPDFAGDVAIGP